VGVCLVVNKISSEADAETVSQFLGLPAFATVPIDDGVRAAERAGAALLDYAPASQAVRAIGRLARRLSEGPPAGRGAPAPDGGVLQTVGPARTGG
jgi:Flp pilus assembly CpaE family ATPase